MGGGRTAAVGGASGRPTDLLAAGCLRPHRTPRPLLGALGRPLLQADAVLPRPGGSFVFRIAGRVAGHRPLSPPPGGGGLGVLGVFGVLDVFGVFGVLGLGLLLLGFLAFEQQISDPLGVAVVPGSSRRRGSAVAIRHQQRLGRELVVDDVRVVAGEAQRRVVGEGAGIVLEGLGAIAPTVVKHPELIVGPSVPGVDREQLLERFPGFLEPPVLMLQQGEVEAHPGAQGVELDRPAVGLLRLRVAARQNQQVAEIVVSLRVVGALAHQLLLRRQGPFEVRRRAGEARQHDEPAGEDCWYKGGSGHGFFPFESAVFR